MRKIYIFLLLMILPCRVFALNGAQLTGFTAINESLGGTGVAMPQDTSTLLVNPAGLALLPRRVDFNVLLAFPHARMDTSAAPLGNPATASGVTGNDDPVILPGGSFNYPTPLLNEKLYVGMGIVPVAGFSLDYPSSRVAAAADAYDTHTFYGLLKVIEGAAYKINDQWAVGLALHVDHAQLETDSAAPPALAQTTGRGRGDGAFGIGFGVGVTYQPFDYLSAGVSYTSEQWMQDFERYTDIMPQGLNFPQQVTAGLSVKPLKKLLVNTDFRWINWSGATGGFGTAASVGGLGWQDQYIGMLGIQYEALDWMTLRAGYNYGRSAIPARSLFASQLAAPITNHHIGGGVGVRLSEKLKLDFSYLRSLSNTVTDDGTSGLVIGGGANASTTLSVNQMSTQVELLF